MVGADGYSSMMRRIKMGNRRFACGGEFAACAAWRAVRVVCRVLSLVVDCDSGNNKDEVLLRLPAVEAEGRAARAT